MGEARKLHHLAEKPKYSFISQFVREHSKLAHYMTSQHTRWGGWLELEDGATYAADMMMAMWECSRARAATDARPYQTDYPKIHKSRFAYTAQVFRINTNSFELAELHLQSRRIALFYRRF